MRKVKKGETYKHFKGHVYRIIAIGKDSEDTSLKVVYQNVYDENDVWIRDYDMFLSEVDHEKYPDIEQKYRFELVKGDN